MEEIFKIIYLLPFDSSSSEGYSKSTTVENATDKLKLYLSNKYNIDFADIAILSCTPIQIIQ
ncbi:hypothetical protein B2H86_15700 [Clostridium botulinum]|uniref:hypothetical protein n=1 Tax=Clostridium botulinum TaxID=1491 RepID=UPI0005863450|nr:hypothetical protein [Clostridium botulinum]AJE13335.1 hypothetical protein T259_4176 [Clostridium botulinum CDC_1436]NFE18545.1 hypothetical protein [Clostridium botulinum]OSA73776.1 hypothetical protein B2H86_15700 [Clostridium botulinum]OSA78737.1 hypothetical protein B2H84_12620 [Clostridium botulinum]BDB03720.1 hypothetical protein CBOS2020_37940 [Clostridium botulinum]